MVSYPKPQEDQQQTLLPKFVFNACLNCLSDVMKISFLDVLFSSFYNSNWIVYLYCLFQ